MVSFQKNKSKVSNLVFFGKTIKENKSIKILGLTIGKTSGLLDHCKEKAALANQRVNLLKMVRGKNWGANRRTLLRLYKQLVRPVLEYGAAAFGKKDKLAIKQLELAERRALRVVTSSHSKSSIQDLYELTGIEPLGERIQSLRLKALARFDHKSKGLQDLEVLKEIIGV